MTGRADIHRGQTNRADVTGRHTEKTIRHSIHDRHREHTESRYDRHGDDIPIEHT